MQRGPDCLSGSQTTAGLVSLDAFARSKDATPSPPRSSHFHPWWCTPRVLLGCLAWPQFQPICRIPERPLELGSSRKCHMHPLPERGWRCLSHLVSCLNDRLHSVVELLARVGANPSLIRVGLRSAGVNIPPDLGVNPEAGQKSAENDLIGFGIGRGEKIA